RERVRTELIALANAHIFKELHAAPAIRRPNIRGAFSDIARVPDALNSSSRMLTKPISGRLLEARVESTVARRVSSSPGRIGASQRTSSMPGAPIELELSTKQSADMRITMQQECQPDAQSPPSMVLRAASSSR